MNEWITDRIPTADDSDDCGMVATWTDSFQMIHRGLIHLGDPWCPIPKAYVSPQTKKQRFAALCHSKWEPDRGKASENIIIGYWAEDLKSYHCNVPYQLRDDIVAMQNLLCDDLENDRDLTITLQDQDKLIIAAAKACSVANDGRCDDNALYDAVAELAKAFPGSDEQQSACR